MSTLKELHQGVMSCQKCNLAKTRTYAVPGEGAEKAEILFIGEGPGYYEDKQGRPFVGPAGQFLDELLTSVGLKREDVYITNIIKCRPPNNRDPLPNEIEACSDWLKEQIELIHPKMVVTLGRHSMARFFPKGSISKLHGTAQKKEGIIYYVMYHPAAALHQQSLRNIIEEDMKKIPELVKQFHQVAEEERKPEQLPMF